MSPIESGNTEGNYGSIEAHQRILEPVRRAEWPGSTPACRIRSAGRVAMDGVQWPRHWQSVSVPQCPDERAYPRRAAVPAEDLFVASGRALLEDIH